MSEVLMSDGADEGDKNIICLDREGPDKQETIVSRSNFVTVSIKNVPWAQEVLVEYQGVVDNKVVGNCSEGWVNMEGKCIRVVTQLKNWKVTICLKCLLPSANNIPGF